MRTILVRAAQDKNRFEGDQSRSDKTVTILHRIYC